MRIASVIIRWFVRVAGFLQVVLGVLFWFGTAFRFIPLHMFLGMAIVVALWLVAGMALFARVPWPRIVLAFLWGIAVVALGYTQVRILPGGAHWIVQVVHLLIGLGAIGQADALAGAILDKWPVRAGVGVASRPERSA
ncbi:MAG TPA: hypothetical protein VFG50_08350 [Rhodothermales bacterium]|nr:hypothetical protein [Rhodothermales bacterium]